MLTSWNECAQNHQCGVLWGAAGGLEKKVVSEASRFSWGASGFSCLLS